MPFEITDEDKLLIYAAYERALTRWRARSQEVERMPKDEFRRGWFNAYEALGPWSTRRPTNGAGRASNGATSGGPSRLTGALGYR